VAAFLRARGIMHHVAKIPEDARARRGEPVIVIDDAGRERDGTIEFGDESTSCISVYCERGGRVVVRDLARLRPDPGGLRPVWLGMERHRKL
jgi:hypothetical protein